MNVIWKNSRVRLLAAFGLCTLIPFGLGYFLFFIKTYQFLEYYWFRLADVMLPFLGSLLLVHQFSRFYRKYDINHLDRRFRLAVISVMAFGIVAFYAGALLKATQERLYSRRARLGYDGFVASSLRDPIKWIRAKTSKDSVFLVNPFFNEFQLLAQRSILVSFKEIPQSPEKIIEWFDRIKFSNGWRAPALTGYASHVEIEQNYNQLSEEQLKTGAELYGFRYYLCIDRNLPHFKKVFSNGMFAIFDLRASSDSPP